MGAWKAKWRHQGQNDLEFPLALLLVNRHSPAGNMKEGEWPGMQEKGSKIQPRMLTMLRRP